MCNAEGSIYLCTLSGLEFHHQPTQLKTHFGWEELVERKPPQIAALSVSSACKWCAKATKKDFSVQKCPGVLHCEASTQSWYFVEHILHVPPAVGPILQLLCSPIGNRDLQKKTKQNIATEVSCRLRILCDKQIVYCNSASTGQPVLMLHCLKQLSNK